MKRLILKSKIPKWDIKIKYPGYQDQVSGISRSSIRDNGYPSQTVPALTNRLIKNVSFSDLSLETNNTNYEFNFFKLYFINY